MDVTTRNVDTLSKLLDVGVEAGRESKKSLSDSGVKQIHTLPSFKVF